MSEIKIKHRTFEIIEEISENEFIATRKGKKYYINKFVPGSEAGLELCYSCLRIYSAAVKAPMLYLTDKKGGYVVREYIEGGEKLIDIISREELSEDIYKQLFLNASLAKRNKITINYEPDKWVLKDGTLYYVYPHFIEYDEEKDLIKRYLRLWFNTKELVQFLNKNGRTFDKNRLKDEYTTNKEIVLMTIKHYR